MVQASGGRASSARLPEQEYFATERKVCSGYAAPKRTFLFLPTPPPPCHTPPNIARHVFTGNRPTDVDCQCAFPRSPHSTFDVGPCRADNHPRGSPSSILRPPDRRRIDGTHQRRSSSVHEWRLCCLMRRTAHTLLSLSWIPSRRVF
jgi:hypothetical protein